MTPSPTTPAWTPAIQAAFGQAWRAAVDARRAGALDAAFAHLERAHILGQQRTWPHVRTHVAMLAIGWQRQDRREVLGQVGRTVAALLFSRVWVPVGNTGGANVSPFRPMPLPADLAPLFSAESVDGR